MILPERVWLLRHAETTAAHVFNGFESDVGLSELGYRQAAAAAQWLTAHKPTAVVSSGMIRAIDTARPLVAATGVPHHIERDLHERKVGPMCGQSFALSEGPWADTVREWTAGNVHFTTPEAESFHEVAARVVPAWERTVQAHPGGRLVIVAHGIVVKVLLLSILHGWDATGWVKLGRVANLAVTELTPGDAGLWQPGQHLLHVPESIACLEQAHYLADHAKVRKSEA